MSRKTKRKLANGLDFAAFTLPALLTVLVSTLIPFAMNLYYSMFEWNGISQNMKFVGLQNFQRIFTVDANFAKAALFTMRFSIFYVLLVNVLALAAAMLLSKTNIVSSISRSFYYIPYIISLIAVSFIWKFIFGPGFDALHGLTGWTFLEWSWLGTSQLAFWAVMAVAIWQNLGFYMIIYIAGITGIPKEVMEAAEIDGSYGFGKFRRVTLPLMMPSVTICIFTSLTYAFKLFDIILVFTEGGPGGSTQSVAFNIYREAFTSNRYGLATAKSVVFFVAVLIVTVVQLGFFKSKEVET